MWMENEGSVIAATRVLAIFSVDIDDVALFDEQRDHNLSASFNNGRFGAALYSITLDARVGAHNLKTHSVWNLNSQHVVAVLKHLHIQALLDELDDVVAELVGGQALLVKGVEVHEDKVVSIDVGVLHGDLFHIGPLNHLAGLEGLVDVAASGHVFQLGAHKGGALARLDVEELEHLVRDAVQFDGDACSKVVGRNYHCRGRGRAAGQAGAMAADGRGDEG